MKIHSDVLTAAHLSSALVTAGLSDVWIEDIEEKGSRQRGHAFDVFPAAAKVKGRRPRATSTGQRGLYAPTYNEYGRWMVELFAIDPRAIIGTYNGVDDFHSQTRYAFDAVTSA